jgi:hypothetical protein
MNVKQAKEDLKDCKTPMEVLGVVCDRVNNINSVVLFGVREMECCTPIGLMLFDIKELLRCATERLSGMKNCVGACEKPKEGDQNEVA